MNQQIDFEQLPSGTASNGITQVCLVIEGGAFRGIYAQGVADYLMQHDINMACTIGCSAGAMTGMNYVSGQIGRSVLINLKYKHVDREKEFSCWKEIEQDLKVPMYFCDPYSPWHRGTNENGNGLFREFFPKGTDFSKVTEEEKQEALRKINMRPKKTLNWKNCWEVFQEEMLQLI